MGKLRTLVLGSAAVMAAGVMAAAPAGAASISIGLQESGVNGGAITNEGSGFPVVSIAGVNYGTFHLNTVTSTESGFGQVELDSTSLNASVVAPGGTLNVYVTEQGITLDQLRFWESTFTENKLPANWSVTEWTALDPANGLFTTPSPLLGGPATFTGPAASFDDIVSNFVFPLGTGPGSLYSVTEKFAITATGNFLNGSANSTIDVAGAPEPSTWAMMLLGFVGLGFLGYRTSRKPVSIA